MKTNMHKLTMISGVARCNDMPVAVFAWPEHAKLMGDHLLRLDRQRHTEWTHYVIEPAAPVECLLVPCLPVASEHALTGATTA